MCMKDSYVCSLHFVGGNVPTEVDPDPMFMQSFFYIIVLSLGEICIPCRGVATQS